MQIKANYCVKKKRTTRASVFSVSNECFYFKCRYFLRWTDWFPFKIIHESNWKEINKFNICIVCAVHRNESSGWTSVSQSEVKQIQIFIQNKLKIRPNHCEKKEILKSSKYLHHQREITLSHMIRVTFVLNRLHHDDDFACLIVYC